MKMSIGAKGAREKGVKPSTRARRERHQRYANPAGAYPTRTPVAIMGPNRRLQYCDLREKGQCPKIKFSPMIRLP
jgi:hypothetical protein